MIDEHINIVQQNLRSTKSALRRKAALEIAKHNYNELGVELLSVFLQEQHDIRTWETQVAMIGALGKIHYDEALPTINIICEQNKAFDEITRAAATAFVRLKRAHIDDALPVINLLETSSYSATMGALDALGYDRMKPGNNEIGMILSLVASKSLSYPKGVGDPRYGLAAAAAGWPVDLVRDFLTSCIKTTDVPLRYVAENALKGKYVKLR